MPQVPPVQLVVAFGAAQGFPHVPQWAGSVSRLTSQPSAGLRLQSAYPVAPVPTWQGPLHAGVLWWPGHAAPQAPQFSTSLVGAAQNRTPGAASGAAIAPPSTT